MKIIKEYILDKASILPQSVYIHTNAEILTLQDTSVGLLLYTLSSPTEPETEMHIFKICDTLETIYFENVKYIGSYQTEHGLRHVIEIDCPYGGVR